MKCNKIFLLTILFFISSSSYNVISYDTFDYTENVVLTIKSYNYLEGITDYTNHIFMIKINTSLDSSIGNIESEGRSKILNNFIDLGSPEVRYFSIIFDVYEIIDEELYRCDLDKDDGIGPAEIIFDCYTGRWIGEDQIGDISGYGRLNGCDDKSYYDFERDFELCFTIRIIDDDGDMIPSWYEENILNTNPLIDNSEDDEDEDLIPLYWEWKWGYDPFEFDDHKKIDPESDGLNNYEEYQTRLWGSDPYCKDIFVELDQMEPGPNGKHCYVPDESKIMVAQTYAKRNIVFHIDDGAMGGGEIIPYEKTLWMGEGREYYRKYFLHDDENNWRRGVFRYALYVNDHIPIKGMEFPGEQSIIKFFLPGLNSYLIATSVFYKAGNHQHACIMLHELGHTLGICMCRPWGCDNQLMRIPFSLQNFLFRNYKSVMNYKYCGSLLDYSDGSHGLGDSNDWEKMDLTYFQPNGAE